METRAVPGLDFDVSYLVVCTLSTVKIASTLYVQFLSWKALFQNFEIFQNFEFSNLKTKAVPGLDFDVSSLVVCILSTVKIASTLYVQFLSWKALIQNFEMFQNFEFSNLET